MLPSSKTDNENLIRLKIKCTATKSESIYTPKKIRTLFRYNSLIV